MVKKVNKKKAGKLHYYGFGMVFILVLIGIIIGLSGLPTNTTGAVSTVTSYGLSDKLISTQPGKIQTLVEFTKPELKSLSTSAGRDLKVPGIVNKIDFKNELLKAYKNKPYATISAGSLNAVATGVMMEADNFDKNTRCFKHIGSNYRKFPNLKLAITSELKFQRCRNKLGWHYGFVEHVFYDYQDDKYICRQDNAPLFAVNDLNGDVSLDTTQC